MHRLRKVKTPGYLSPLCFVTAKITAQNVTKFIAPIHRIKSVASPIFRASQEKKPLRGGLGFREVELKRNEVVHAPYVEREYKIGSKALIRNCYVMRDVN
jgi:hypothetical protein